MALALELAGQDRVPPDSEIHVPGRNLGTALFGIDIGVGELAAAKQLGYDLVIAHHPAGGRATVGFPKVLSKHVDILTRHGVPAREARRAVAALRRDAVVRYHAANYDRVPSFARLLGMPFMSIHNPADEIGRRVMDETLARGVDAKAKVEDAMDVLAALPEFRAARTSVVLRMGRRGNALGRYAVVHGAGTNGGFPVARAAFRHGIDTVVYIHIDPGHLTRLHETFGARGDRNLIVTGHIASDSIGINAIVRRLREEGLAVDCVGGVLDVPSP
jgi:putative NIF3 family GTP cyclohydrolase 1 type 2